MWHPASEAASMYCCALDGGEGRTSRVDVHLTLPYVEPVNQVEEGK